MKTPMQEMLEWVRATLPMDLDTPQMIEQKIESLLEKERDHCNYFAFQFRHEKFTLKDIKKEYDATFNTENK